MKSAIKCNWLPILYLVLLFLVSCSPETVNQQNMDIETITSISNARAKAFNEGKAEGISMHFSDGAYLMAPGSVTLRGQVAIREYYQKIFDEYETELVSGYEDVVVNGDLAYGRGFAKVILKPKEGGEVIYASSKYLNILEKQKDGIWKTTHDIWNSNETE